MISNVSNFKDIDYNIRRVKEQMIKEMEGSYLKKSYSVVYYSFDRNDFPSSYDGGFIYEIHGEIRPDSTVPEKKRETIHLTLYYALCRKEAAKTVDRLVYPYKEYSQKKDEIENRTHCPKLEEKRETILSEVSTIICMVSRLFYLIPIGLTAFGFLFPESSKGALIVTLISLVINILIVGARAFALHLAKAELSDVLYSFSICSTLFVLIFSLVYAVYLIMFLAGIDGPSGLSNYLAIISNIVLAEVLLYFVGLLIESLLGKNRKAFIFNFTRKSRLKKRIEEYEQRLVSYKKDLDENKESYERITKTFAALPLLYCVKESELKKKKGT